MKYESKQNRRDYCPPLLGNGDIAFFTDSEGCLGFCNENVRENYIFRAGRRMWEGARLIPIGTFSFLPFESAAIKEFSQELICEDGVLQSSSIYENSLKTETVSFIHPKYNIYSFKKIFSKQCENSQLYFTLKGFDEDTENAILQSEIFQINGGIKIVYTANGRKMYSGAAVLIFDRNITAEIIDGKTAKIRFSACENDEITFYFFTADSLDGKLENKINELHNKINILGFDGLLKETKEDWNAFYGNSFINTEDETLNQLYKTALYNMKCYTTQWSIPVGISNRDWNGKFFAFDEYYSFLALLESGKDILAKRVPEFRLKVCLPKAVYRATSNHGLPQARFMWETLENGDEGAPIGHWIDHIFHVVLVGLGAYQYYEYTGDIDFLRECYPLISACAMFYTKHHIYKDSSGKMYVGKCTDLERLGPSIENPFMTACGVIAMLETLVKVSEILDCDKEYRNECRETAIKLKESLPSENGKYVPYLGSTDKSIAVFAGKFPYNVLENNDKKMLSAWDDYEENESKFGNMYKTGNGTCPWYACWKSLGFSRTGLGNKAYNSLKQAYKTCGVFGEMFEINEPTIFSRPWFTTASGMFVSAANEMLLQSDGENIYILPASPLENLSFKLPVKGGAMIEAEVCDGKLVKTEITMKEKVATKSFNIYFKGKKI